MRAVLPAALIAQEDTSREPPLSIGKRRTVVPYALGAALAAVLGIVCISRELLVIGLPRGALPRPCFAAITRTATSVHHGAVGSATVRCEAVPGGRLHSEAAATEPSTGCGGTRRLQQRRRPPPPQAQQAVAPGKPQDALVACGATAAEEPDKAQEEAAPDQTAAAEASVAEDEEKEKKEEEDDDDGWKAEEFDDEDDELTEEEALLEAKAQAQDEVDKEIDGLIRLQADLQNYRRQHAESMSRTQELGKQDALRKLVPFQAEIDATLEPPEGMSEKEQKLFDSYTLLFRKVSNLWEKNNVTPQEVEVGGKFDADNHRKVGEREAEGEEEVPGTIIEVVSPGWNVEGKVLVPSEVKIVAFPEKVEIEEGGEEGGEEKEAIETEEEVKA
eukprot:CAMPEP_0180756494 /NCGR_PEP_ID=MMETSP1038_2-20121128/34262_1 /TAXON_ID=632150 /ORGANISM="Azadinium spinosum, Strain 3D9" /LENGTH=387 /DNA_ID=CAMNT_0022790483 /DNA_START=108 /DNA_END=1272 /DNA_ORIENTATION=+